MKDLKREPHASFAEPFHTLTRSNKQLMSEPFEPKLTFKYHTRLKIKKNPNLSRTEINENHSSDYLDEGAETIAIYKKKT